MRTLTVKLSSGPKVFIDGRITNLQEFCITAPNPRALKAKERQKICSLLKEALNLDPFFSHPPLNDANHV